MGERERELERDRKGGRGGERERERERERDRERRRERESVRERERGQEGLDKHGCNSSRSAICTPESRDIIPLFTPDYNFQASRQGTT